MTAGVTEPKAAAELPHWDMSNVYSGLNQDDSTRALRWQSWLAAALILNRMDTVLFVAPVLALAVWRLKPRGVWRPALPPLLVCGAWFGFATIYYGSPFPNTAAAKLGSGASLGELIELGWHYLAASLREDPVTLVTILAAGLLTVAGTQGGPQNVLALENAGNPEIILKNTATNNTWEISAGNNFLFRKEGGANLMTLSNSGAMTIAGPITTGAS